MTQTKQTNVRLATYTRKQLDDLAEMTGMSLSEVIQTAIDRMHREMIQPATANEVQEMQQ